MILARRARAFTLIGMALAAVAFPVLQSDARPKKPPMVVVPPPPPPPPVGLSDRLVADAAAYEAYIDATSAISPNFTDGPSVARALKAGASFETKAMIRGAIAYGAIAALQDRTFVATVRSYGPTSESRRVLVNAIYANSAYALTFPHADGAAGYAKQALNERAMRLFYAGKKIKQSAYDIQRQPWSKEFVADREGRLNAIKTLSSISAVGPTDRAMILRSMVAGLSPSVAAPPPAARPPYTPLIAHAISLAALAALGEADDASYQRVSYLTTEVNTDFCMSMAKLNLYQCLAVAKPHYEDVFCLGQHAMIDTGICLARYTGAVLPLEVFPRPLKVPPPRSVRAKPRPRRR